VRSTPTSPPAAATASRSAWRRPRHHHRPLAQRSEQQMGEGLERSRDPALGHGLLEPTLDEPEAVPRVDLAPRLPAEHDRPVAENDPLHARVHRGLEERSTASPEPTPRVGSAGAGRRRFHERLLRLVENGEEDRLLVGEMVVEGALGDARAGGDVLDERPRVAAGANSSIPSDGGLKRSGGSDRAEAWRGRTGRKALRRCSTSPTSPEDRTPR